MSGQTEDRRSWLGSIPGDDLDVYELSGFGGPSGFGERPALLVIDVQYRTAGDRPAPIREAITTMYPTACGDRAWAAMPHIARLLGAAREAAIPIVFPYVAPKKAVDAGRFGSINPAITSISDRGYEFVAEVAPEEGDVLGAVAATPATNPPGLQSRKLVFPVAEYMLRNVEFGGHVSNFTKRCASEVKPSGFRSGTVAGNCRRSLRIRSHGSACRPTCGPGVRVGTA